MTEKKTGVPKMRNPPPPPQSKRTMNTAEEIKRLATFIDDNPSLTDLPIDSEDCERIAKEILKHYLPSSALVRPLEFALYGDVWVCNTMIGRYRIETSKGFKWEYEGRRESRMAKVKSLIEAKDACQKDFEHRVGSCLQGGGYTEEQVIGFPQWMYKNRWYSFDIKAQKWCQSFEHGTRISDKTYQEKHMKTAKELFTLYLTALKQQ